MQKVSKGSKIAFAIGAIIGVILIKREPDGNLLVTNVCALMGGTSALLIWKLFKFFFV